MKVKAVFLFIAILLSSQICIFAEWTTPNPNNPNYQIWHPGPNNAPMPQPAGWGGTPPSGLSSRPSVPSADVARYLAERAANPLTMGQQDSAPPPKQDQPDNNDNNEQGTGTGSDGCGGDGS